jgi:NitT/TauT family transport system ATP-binding protein
MTMASQQEFVNDRDLAIHVDRVEQEFTDRSGKVVRALDEVSFSVPRGQFLAVIGPSGCGKTTVLNMLAGLLQPTAGSVRIHGETVVKPRTHVGYMSARDGLLPWRTTRRNVALGLEIRGVPREERLRRADDLLSIVGLAGFETAFRSQLSQGMRQRAAIARTLAIDPQVLLMDEPFAALDAQTKVILQQQFSKIWENDRKTVMLVTHDLEEAVALADRVIVFSSRPGRIVVDRTVDLPRPRDIETVRFEPRFRELTQELWNALRVSIPRLS